MAACTLLVEAGEKLERTGGGVSGAEGVGAGRFDGNEADNLVILSWKWFRKDVARADGERVLGRVGGVDGESKEFMVDHSFLG